MQPSYRIIIAQDDAALASLLTRLILRRYPTAVVQAFGNGQDALDAYDQAGADLLFVNHRHAWHGWPNDDPDSAGAR